MVNIIPSDCEDVTGASPLCDQYVGLIHFTPYVQFCIDMRIS